MFERLGRSVIGDQYSISRACNQCGGHSIIALAELLRHQILKRSRSNAVIRSFESACTSLDHDNVYFAPGSTKNLQTVLSSR